MNVAEWLAGIGAACCVAGFIFMPRLHGVWVPAFAGTTVDALMHTPIRLMPLILPVCCRY
jgi:hypothetical protein